jgi:ribosome-binding protein aMBF1 (putative translation factor)
MTKRKTLMDEIRKELHGDRELDALYQKALSELEIAHQIARAREHAGLSQSELAKKLRTKQTGVARLERADYRGYSLTTLAKVAAATGAKLEVRITPINRKRQIA